MEVFKFKLQKLLDIRIDMEEESKIKFKEAQLIKEETENKLKNLKQDYENTSKKDSSSLVEWKIKLNYLNAVNNAIDNTKVELNENIRNLEEKRKELEKKQIERKTVETLKEKKEFAYNKEMDLIEQRNNDEYALFSFIRMKNTN